MDSNLPSTWMVNQWCLFWQANHGLYSNPCTQLRVHNKEFGAGLKADLTKGLHCSFVWCRLIIRKAWRHNYLTPSPMFIFFSGKNCLNICMWPLIQKKNKIIGQNLLKKYYFYYDPRPGGELVAGEDEIDGLKRSMTEVSYLPLVMSLQHCFVFVLF